MATVPLSRLFAWGVVLGRLCAGSPARAQQVGVAAFAERGAEHQAQGAYVSLSFDLDRRSPERALAAPASAFGGSVGSTFEVDPDDLADPVPDRPGVQLSTPPVPASPVPALPVPALPVPWPTPAASLPAPLPGASAPPSHGSAAIRPKRWSKAFLPRLIEAALLGRKQTLAELESVRERARIAGWLPVLTVRAGRNSDRSLRLTPTDSDPDRWQLTGGSDLRLEAQVSWDLDRLAFAPEEIALERLRAQHFEAEQVLVKRVLDLVARWLRSELALQALDLLPEEQTQHWLERMAAESELDVLSRGWFSAHLRVAWEATVN